MIASCDWKSLSLSVTGTQQSSPTFSAFFHGVTVLMTSSNIITVTSTAPTATFDIVIAGQRLLSFSDEVGNSEKEPFEKYPIDTPCSQCCTLIGDSVVTSVTATTETNRLACCIPFFLSLVLFCRISQVSSFLSCHRHQCAFNSHQRGLFQLLLDCGILPVSQWDLPATTSVLCSLSFIIFLFSAFDVPPLST